MEKQRAKERARMRTRNFKYLFNQSVTRKNKLSRSGEQNGI